MNCISHIHESVTHHSLRGVRGGLRKWHLVGKMMFLLEEDLFLKAKINMGNSNFYCFCFLSLTNLFPMIDLLTFSSP